MSEEKYNTPNSNCCGRPMNYSTAPQCNYTDACMQEYCCPELASIKETEPGCKNKAVIPSVTVDSVEGITNLANCFVHVNDINTTFYVDDKHRIMITWAGPVDIPGYDMDTNPEGFKNQIVTDKENDIAVIYDSHGVGYTFGIEKGLDVTEAVNNKLDEMAEDGTLEGIIADYLDTGAVWAFDTVADMKAADYLANGSYARTLGFHTINDGGGALYKITDTGTANEMDIIAINELYASLIKPTLLAPEMVGAYGDGIHDDTTYIQRCVDIGNNIYFGNGKTYNISKQGEINNLCTNLTMFYGILIHNSNKNIDGRNATIRCLDATPTGFFTNDTSNLANITIRNLNVVMDNTTQTYNPVGSTTKLKLINFDKCNDITINNIRFRTTVGDCIEVLQGNNITITNIDIDDTVGHGISVGKLNYEVNYLTLKDCIIKNQKVYDNAISTNPVILSIIDSQIDNIKMYSCDWGFKIQEPSHDVIITNCGYYDGTNVSENTGFKIQGTSGSHVKNISLINCDVVNNASNGYSIYDIYSENTMIDGCQILTSKGLQTRGANVTIRNCYLYNSKQGIYIRQECNKVSVENCTIKCDDANYFETSYINCQSVNNPVKMCDIDIISTLSSASRYITFNNAQCSNINIYADEILGAGKFGGIGGNAKFTNCNFNANQGKTYRVNCENGSTSTTLSSAAFPLTPNSVTAWFSYKGVNCNITNVTHTNGVITFTHDAVGSGAYILVQLEDYYMEPSS